MDKTRVLMLVDEHDAPHLDMAATTDEWELSWMVIDYNDLYRSLPTIREVVRREKIDFLMFSRNDQVAGKVRIGPIIRSLGIGYSTFSGIDDLDRVDQMKACFSDFLSGGRTIAPSKPTTEAPRPVRKEANGTFTLVFDIEQMGCVRFALDRVLGVLDEHGVTATFFATNIMKRVYPCFLPEITSRGHEVGIHGKWHEYLSNYDLDTQTNLIRETLDHFGHDVQGANYLYRMNAQTIEALIANKMRYFLSSSLNHYRPFGYPKLSTTPVLVRSPRGSIYMIGASLETYKGPWQSVRNMIDSAFEVSRHSTKHITILCHPFRDGTKRNLVDLNKMVEYIMDRKGLAPITLSDMIGRVGHQCPSIGLDSWPLPSNGTAIVRPSNLIDLKGLVPENFMRTYRALKTRHELQLESRDLDDKGLMGGGGSGPSRTSH